MNVLVYFIDWIIGYVYDGVFGWVGFILIVSMYYMIFRFFKREIYLGRFVDF